MNGPIAQIVALTCYGNAFLSGQSVAPLSLSNSTCQFCERVAFVTLDTGFFGKTKEIEVAPDPGSWFAYLKGRGASGLRLSRAPQNDPEIPDRMAAAFVGGGGTWTLEARLPGGRSEVWMARWEVGNQAAPDQRIWRVTYGRIAQGRSKPPPVPDLPKAARELRESLEEVRDFSAAHKHDGFMRCFENALDALKTEGRNQHGYHADLAPDGFLSQEAAALLDACQAAWVFGGMGSWNDLVFEGEDQKTYNRISERLFQAVNAAIEQAAADAAENGPKGGGFRGPGASSRPPPHSPAAP